MKDLIAERDKKEKMEHSVVKWWNVHYMTPDELGVSQPKKPEPEVEVVSMDQVHAGAVSSVNESAKPMRPDEEKTADLTGQMTEEQMQAAQDIIDRLNREAAMDEAAKQREIEAARASAENIYNPTTGANSGLYGTGGADNDHKSQIDAILAEKDDAFQDMLGKAF